MSTLTITEFLEARIAEDEAVVAYPSPHERSGGYSYADVGGLSEVLTVGTTRVLAECAAKRAIIQWAGQVDAAEDQMAREWGTPEVMAYGILRALAAVYSSHPGYQQEWAL